jgi:hypothetical protein
MLAIDPAQLATAIERDALITLVHTPNTPGDNS